MPPKRTNWGMYGKMTIVGLGICIGGPLLVMYLSPTEEELFMKYNPDLQRRSLANRAQNQEEFDQFIGRLKEYSKDSKRPVWEVAAQEEKRMREQKRVEQEELMKEVKRRKEEMRREQELEAEAKVKKSGWSFWR